MADEITLTPPSNLHADAMRFLTHCYHDTDVTSGQLSGALEDNHPAVVAARNAARTLLSAVLTMRELETVIVQRREVAPGDAHPYYLTATGLGLEQYAAQELKRGKRSIQIFLPTTTAGQYRTASGARGYTLLELLNKVVKRK